MNEVFRIRRSILRSALPLSSFVLLMNELLEGVKRIVRKNDSLMIEVDADALVRLKRRSALERSDDVSVEGTVRVLFHFDLIDRKCFFELSNRPEATQRDVHPLPFSCRRYTKKGVEV